MPQHAIRVYLQPLAWPSYPVDLDRGALKAAGEILACMCGRGISNHPDSFKDRYREISEADGPLFMVPEDVGLRSTVVEPLKQAKAAYTSGNYVAAAAISGTVCEALAILRWAIQDPKTIAQRHTPGSRRVLKGCAFEKLPQQKRIRTLLELRLVTEEEERRLSRALDLRDLYAHHNLRDHEKSPADARECYAHAVWLAAAIIGTKIVDGAWAATPEMWAYLKRRGFLKSADDVAGIVGPLTPDEIVP